MIELSVGQNLGLLGLAFGLIILYWVTERHFDDLVWGLRVIHYTALALAVMVVVLDVAFAVMVGRFLTAIVAVPLAVFAALEVYDKVKELRREYQYQQKRAKRKLAKEDAAKQQQEGAEQQNDVTVA